MAAEFFTEKSIEKKGMGLDVLNLGFVMESHGVGKRRKGGWFI